MKVGKSIKFFSFNESTSEFVFKIGKDEVTFIILENDKPIMSAIEINDGLEQGHCYFQAGDSKDHVFIYCDMKTDMEVQAVLTKK